MYSYYGPAVGWKIWAPTKGWEPAPSAPGAAAVIFRK
jgi:hypothetical protein